MENKSEHSINVFGKEITIFNPKAYIKTISKTPILPISKDQKDFFKGKEVVFLYSKNQYGKELQVPIFTMDFGKSEYEFIAEFMRRNSEYTSQ
jgi:hypothetical protein